jgi:hypothetical protein
MDTEIEQPRAADGTFTSGEQKFGLAGVGADAGYTQFSTPQQDDPGIEDNPEVLRAEFDKFVERGGDVGDPDYDPDPIVLQDSDGKQLPENVTVTAEQAGAALSGYQHQVGSYVEGMVLDNLVADIDAARAQVLKNDPSLANEYGLDPAQVAANAAKLEQKAEQTEQPTTDATKEPVAEAPVDGLEPKLAEALKHPQVRAAVEEEIGKAGQARQQYETALNFTHALAQQSLVEKLPELAQVPVDQWANAIVAIAQQDPNRVGNALDSIKRVNDVQVASQQYQKIQETQRQQQIETWAKDQSAKHDAWLAQEGVKVSELNPSMESYLERVGTNRDEIMQLAQRVPELRSDTFQRIFTDAIRFHAMQSAAKPLATRGLPPVVRPGASGASRVNDNSSKLAALNAALDGATTEVAQLNIAREILKLKGAA